MNGKTWFQGWAVLVWILRDRYSNRYIYTCLYALLLIATLPFTVNVWWILFFEYCLKILKRIDTHNFSGSTSNSPNFDTWLLLSNSQATSLIWSAHTVSLACCDHPHRSFCQFRRLTWTLLLVVSQLLLRDFGTLFHWTVELLHSLTHLRSVSRHFSLIWYNGTVARASVLWLDINWLIDWLIDWT